MKTIEIQLFKFNELSDKAKEKAIKENYNWNICFDWWDSIYEDAKNVGIKINSFELDRNRYAKGNFINDAIFCANKIKLEHGKDCETYRSAIFYLSERDAIVSNAPNEEEDDREYYESLEECDNDFLQSILEDYSIILQREYEYLTSDEEIIEALEMNEIEFTIEGETYN